MYEEFIQERIAELRTAKGVSARKMSTLLGQNFNYINHIERKKSLPSLPSLLYICDYFNITPKDFFDVDNQNPEVANQFTDILKRLSEGDIKQLLNIAKKFIK